MSIPPLQMPPSRPADPQCGPPADPQRQPAAGAPLSAADRPRSAQPAPPSSGLATKLFALAGVALVLLLALHQVGSLLEGRQASAQSASDELGQTYTAEQTVFAPYVVQPFEEQWSETQLDAKGKPIGTVNRSKIRATLVFAESTQIQGDLSPDERYRGLFKVLFYRLQAKGAGRFPAFDLASVAHTETASHLRLLPAHVVMGFGDVRGLGKDPVLQVGGRALNFVRGVPVAEAGHFSDQTLSAPLPLDPARTELISPGFDFTLDFNLVGKQRLAIVATAGDLQASIKSSWPHPRFGGRFLATQHDITPQGFTAQWRVSALVSSARTQLIEAIKSREAKGQRSAWDSFDVTIIEPVNPYVITERALKYGILLIGLVLGAAFLFEVVQKHALHPVQYGLVGLSISVFFLMLLALSEKLPLAQAYGLAAGASVLLLGVYFGAVLNGWLRGLSLGVYVAVLYGAMYVLLVSENDALLLGAWLVFGVLAVFMLLTRNTNWSALGRGVGGAQS